MESLEEIPGFFFYHLSFYLNCGMDKAQLLTALTASGEVSVFRATPTWRQAFDLHNKTTGKHKNPNCGTCFKDVLAWLRQP